ncbi:helix-hairpin-helix domain-containing protein [Streptomyces sp. SHP 1-2]|uniref:helix-hairpin-helix domain-containing protein n=1 Tax=Streptomyces sp. SHP 1-2 TaxID=2769489 RepID=UPI0039E187E2
MSTEPAPTGSTEGTGPAAPADAPAGSGGAGAAAGTGGADGGSAAVGAPEAEAGGSAGAPDAGDSSAAVGSGPGAHGGPQGEAMDGDGAEGEADLGAGSGGGAEARHAAADGPRGDGADGEAEEPGTTDSGSGADSGGAGGAESAEAAEGKDSVSEAAAELAAQRVERERIERRRAERTEPIASGAGLSGTAADLLAAVRAVEKGAKPPAGGFDGPAPAPRRPAPPPVPAGRAPAAPPSAAVPPAPAGPAPETVRAVREVLAEGGAPEALAPTAAALLGESAGSVLREDPWQLLRLPEVRPEQADGFARALLGAECGPGDERRGRALTVRQLERAALGGHTALELSRLTAALSRQGVPDADAAVQSALAEGDALVFQDALDEPGGHAEDAPAGEERDDDEDRPVRVLVGLERYALAEESLADALARLAASTPKRDGAAPEWEREAAAARGSAAELIRAVADHGLVLHTGGEASLAEPAALLRAARALGLRAWAAAHGPLGRDRLAALAAVGAEPAASPDAAAGGPAPDSPAPGGDAPDGDAPGASAVTTVAGLLAGSEGPGRDTDGALDLDLLVVADAPQLDVETAALLAESLPDGARLVLSGDPSVLGSAGPGRVFADLLASRLCPRVASRRPDPGPLGELVSGIGAGELGRVEAPGKEIVIVPVRDAGEAVHRTVQLVVDSVPRAIGVPAGRTQVITPGHGGAAGTRALNAALKERLNPGPGRFGGFDPGDLVAYSPAPGRTVPGRVEGADAEGLRLSCGGESVVVPRERVERSVRHGWALTAHQAVGGRWPAVVVVLPGDAAGALSRPWVYTAFGRAVRHLSVVHGVEQALPRAVAEVPAAPRTTRLPVLLAPHAPTDG